jgi:hypothetical protein
MVGYSWALQEGGRQEAAVHGKEVRPHACVAREGECTDHELTEGLLIHAPIAIPR